MANVILYRLKIEGQDVVVKTQKELRDAIKQANKEFEQVDKASERYKELEKDIGGLKAVQKGLRDEVRQTSKQFVRDVQTQEGSFDQLRATLDLLKADYKALGRAAREGTEGREILANIRAVREEWNQVRKDLGEGLFNNFQAALQDTFQRFSAALTGDIGAIGAALGASGPLAAGLEFLSEGIVVLDQLGDKIVRLRGEVQQLTGLTGDDLTRVTSDLLALSETFQVPENELLLAANALTEQLTGDFDQSLELIEKGFLAGADANNEFLDSLREYPTFFRDANLSGEQLISTITQSVREGIFSDKGADLIKETTLRLRELPTATVEALNAIGIQGEEIRKKIGEEGIGAAFQLVQERLQQFEDDAPEVGRVLADVFGGPGEDAGIQFIRTLDLTQESIDDLIDPTNDLVAAQQRQIEVERQLAAAQQELVGISQPLINELKLLGAEVLVTVIQNFLRFIELIRAIPRFISENKVELAALTAALTFYNRAQIVAIANQVRTNALLIAGAVRTRGLALAQTALNVVMRANPIGLIVTGISALIIALSQAYKRSETFRASIAGLGAVAKEVFEIIKEVVTNFIEGFNQLKEGNIKGALQQFGQGIIKSNPIGLAFTQGQRLKDAFNQGFNDKLEQERNDADQQKIADALTGGDALTDRLTGQGEEAGEGFSQGVTDGVKKNLTQLKAERDKIQATLSNLSPEAPEFGPTLAKLRAVEKQIKDIETQIKGTTKDATIKVDTDPAVGSIKALRSEISALKESLETTTGSDTDIKEKLEAIVEKEEELEALENRIESLRKSLEREASIDLFRELDQLPSIDTTGIQLESITEELELQTQRQIQVLERQRFERLKQLRQQNVDEETFNRERERINLEADAAILRQRLALTEKNSLEYLQIREQMFEKERQLAQDNNDIVAERRVESIRRYVTEGLDIVQEFSDSLFELRLEEVERVKDIRLQALTEEEQRRLEFVEAGSLEEERIKKELEVQKVEIERDAAKETKEIRIKQAIINTALAVGNALATTQPFIPAALIAAGIAAVRGAIEVATIRSQTFWHGGHTGDSDLAPDQSGHRPVGIVHEHEYVVPTRVLTHPHGKKLVKKLEAMRIQMGYPMSTGRLFAEGGLTSIPGAAGISAETNVNVKVRLEEGEIERMAEAVGQGAKAGTRQGSQEGLDTATRLKERQQALEERLNI